MPPRPAAPPAPSFGATVRDLRRLAGLARPALAERLRAAGLRVPTAWVGRIERDEMGAALTAPLVRALAEALGGDPEALWAAARATMAAAPASEPDGPVPDAPADAFVRALHQWLASNDYAVGFSTDVPAGLEAGELGRKAAGWIASLVGASLPMAITGGGTAGAALHHLVPFLPHADLLAYRVVLGTPTVFPVVLADALDAGAVRERLATFRELAQPLAALALGFNGQGGFAAVTPLFIYFREAAYASDDGAGAVLTAGYVRPTPRAAALREDRVMVWASAANVPAGLLATAAPPPDSVAGRLRAWARRGLASTGLEGYWDDKTGTFTADDLRTVLALADHYASTT